MRRRHLVAAVPFLAAVVLVSGTATVQACTVSAGDSTFGSIMGALGPDRRTLTVEGTCVGDVYVNLDDVTIGGSGIMVGQVTVDGAQRFAIHDVTIANSPAIGIYVIDGSSAEISNVTVEYANDSGIDVRFGSFARILDSRIENNVWGLSVNKGGVVDGYRNVMANNREEQVDLAEHGTYRGSAETIDQGLGTYALSVTRNSYLNLRQDSRVTGRTSIVMQSHLRTRDHTTVTGDISVDLQSALDLAEETAVEGDIETRNLSIVRVLGDATVDGTVRCYRTSICMED